VSARPILVVGSLAYDDVRTPVASRDSVLGGAASYFSMAASLYAPVRLVGVVGDDFREEDVARLAKRGIDTGGLERRTGRSFRWRGTYDFALDTAETINTDLGVFGDWRPQIPPQFTDSEFVFLANIHPEIQLATLQSGGGRNEALRWIRAQAGKTVRLIAIDDVDYLRSDAKYTIVAWRDGGKPAEAVVRTPLKELLERLDAEQFAQVHRSVVVNLRAISHVKRHDNETAEIHVKGRDDVLPVSRNYLHLFRQM